ncbi:cupin domain-containing protein [Solwaraspora sp. WMMD1047]|uniref:cupin domain-containing protein n=1 Tax=Solwaraspora sp. WMMD1047 TaxID=3016102 RepID=UPI002416AD20|nr:cupin domain-containing protein [Solwaraspora sp. WMMD1047]MDG4834871.1 cupin domain-containing protein [Solwaraspora sp. WMMD1047]
MTLIRTSQRERLTAANRPDGCAVFSAGQFLIHADGTGRFDRHYHEFEEFWLIASGSATVLVGDTTHRVAAGDIIRTAPGLEHDILDVADELRVFWVSVGLPPGSTGAHLHRTPDLAVKHLVPVASRRAAGE